MNCPACGSHLVCGCPECLTLPEYAGKPRFFRPPYTSRIVCNVCGFAAEPDEWLAHNAMDALIPTDDDPTELTMLGFEMGTETMP